jgi:hypothetical protein
MSAAAAGYSRTPLWKKLGVKPAGRLMLLGAPRGWSAGELPDGATQTAAPLLPARDAPGAEGRSGDVTVVFARSRAELAQAIEPLARRVHPDGALWVAWPRRAGGHESDIREQDLREEALPLGLVDNKVAALDEDWSGLRLVWRLEHRDAAPPAPRG